MKIRIVVTKASDYLKWMLHEGQEILSRLRKLQYEVDEILQVMETG